MSTVAATTQEIKTSTRYTYDHTHLPPLAMVGTVTEAEAFAARPNWVLDILYLLSSVYYTRLGDYGDNYFTDPVIQDHLTKFQRELIKIEDEINERNKTRTQYEFLLPSKIPQSINI